MTTRELSPATAPATTVCAGVRAGGAALTGALTETTVSMVVVPGVWTAPAAARSPAETSTAGALGASEGPGAEASVGPMDRRRPMGGGDFAGTFSIIVLYYHHACNVSRTKIAISRLSMAIKSTEEPMQGENHAGQSVFRRAKKTKDVHEPSLGVDSRRERMRSGSLSLFYEGKKKI
jgi:hypothetical protein